MGRLCYKYAARKRDESVMAATFMVILQLGVNSDLFLVNMSGSLKSNLCAEFDAIGFRPEASASPYRRKSVEEASGGL